MMNDRQSDVRKRILERRAMFLSASLASLQGCAGPVPLTPLPSQDMASTPSAPSSPADDSAAPVLSAQGQAVQDASAGDAGDELLSDAGGEADAARVVVRSCLSIILPPRPRFEPFSARIIDGTEYIGAVSGVMREHPELVVEVQGHADSNESDRSGQLSLRRADAVIRLLVGQGVRPDRLCRRGFGSARPFAPNDTPGNRAKNRRVEFRKMDEGETCTASPLPDAGAD